MTSLQNKKELPPVYYFTVIAMVSPVAMNILVPAMPDIAKGLGITTAEVQLSLTLYLFCVALGQLVCGPLADRFGRKPVLLTGIALHFAGCVIGAFSSDIEGLLVARVLQAFGGCTGMVLVRTIMLDRHSRDVAAGKIGYVTLAIALAQAIAPTLGGHINLQLGWQYLFHFSLLLSSVSWLIVLFALPETAKSKTDSLRLNRIFLQYRDVLFQPGYLRFTLPTTFVACSFFLFLGSAPYIVTGEMGGSSADLGNWFLLVSAGFMLGSFISGKCSKSFGTHKMIRVGLILALCASVLMLLAQEVFYLSYFTLFIPMALLTFARGLVQPNCQAAAISCTDTSPSVASGLMGFIQLLSGAFVAQLAPIIMDSSLLNVPMTILLLSVSACFVFLFFKNESDEQAEQII